MLNGNIARNRGGGIYANTGYGAFLSSKTDISNCFLFGNVASNYGGGMYYDNNILTYGCVVSNNTSYGQGGGISVIASSTNPWTCIRRCVITGNTASNIGGVHLYNSTMDASVVAGNKAWASDAGVYCQWSSIRNSLVVSNTAQQFDGAGDLVYSTAENCTFSGNRATNTSNSVGGMYVSGSNTLLRNCVIYYNFPRDIYRTYYGTNSASYFSYCCTPTNFVGNHCITNSPQFVNRAAGNYHLLPSSACIDKGTNLAWMAAATDLDGNPRIDAGTLHVDIGCYESAAPEPAAASALVVGYWLLVARRKLNARRIQFI